MNAQKLYEKIDIDFEIDKFKDDWSFVEYNEFINPDFKEKYIGVMLDNTYEIEKVYTSTFPDTQVLDDIFSLSPSPYFTFHEIDENKPESSIKLRVETMHYFLQRVKEDRLYTEGPRWQKSLSAV